MFLSQTLPYPPHGGVEARTFNILRLLAEEFDITALCFYRRRGAVQGRIEEATRALSAFGRIEAFEIPQEWSTRRLVADHLRSILSGRVYTVGAYESRAFRSRLEALLATQSFDLVHLDSMDLSGYLPLLLGMPVVCTHHNVESQLLTRRASVTRPALSAAYLRHQARLMAREEARIAPQVRLNVAVSQADAAYFEALKPPPKVQVVPNGVDVTEFLPGPSTERDLIAFLGGTSWFPNLDAMEWFCTNVLPIIRAKGADPRVVWVGKARPEEIDRFRRRHRVTLTGYVTDVRPHIQPATVFVVPLRFGGGTRLKILDAWAMGKAVVSTAVGCEGLETRDGENIIIRDMPEAFAEAVLSLLADPGRVAALGRSARATAERLYSWKVIGVGLTSAYRSVIGGSAAGLPAPGVAR